MAADGGFHAGAGEPHIQVLPCADPGQGLRPLSGPPVQEQAPLVLSGHLVSTDTVADAEGPLVGEAVRTHGQSVQRPRHDDKTAVSALCRPVAEGFLKVQKLVELRAAHDIHDAVVVHRSVLIKAVGPFLLQLVGQVPAPDQDHAPAKPVRRLPDLLSQPVVVRQRQPRQPDADDPVGVRIQVLIQKIEGDHRSVVQRRGPLPHRAARKIIPVAEPAESMHECMVVGGANADTGRPKLPEVPLRSQSRRNVKVIRVHHAVRRCDHHCLRLQGSGKLHGRPVGVCRCLDLFFFSASDLRQDDRRMRHHDRSDNCHRILLSCLFHRQFLSIDLFPLIRGADLLVRPAAPAIFQQFPVNT